MNTKLKPSDSSPNSLDPLIDADKFRELKERLFSAQEIVVMTGAGISSDSGIPTFRGNSNSLWNLVDPEAFSSIRKFEKKPRKVWSWHHDFRNLLSNAQPNPGHFGVSRLQDICSQARFTVITQNIDGLHQRAGSRDVIELHGNISRIKCHKSCGFTDTWTDKWSWRSTCPDCGAPIRPDVVWFGESLPPEAFALAEVAALNADVLFSIGTSSFVQPAASLQESAKAAGAILIEVNPVKTFLTSKTDYSFQLGASVFLQHLCNELSSSTL